MSAAETTVAAPSRQPAPAKPRRRWLQFSLRSLTIFMALCCVLLGAFAWRLQRARKQAAAVATLRELRSRTVLYDFEMRAIQQQRPGLPRSAWPTFLVQTLGQDFFHDIYAVNSADQPPDRDGQAPPDTTEYDRDRFWDCVTQFPHLRQLCVAGRWMDRSRLARLQNPQEIEILSITDFPVTDDDLKVIGCMTRLKTLQMYRSHYPITDEGIAALDNLSDLEAFSLADSHITDGAAEHLAKHPNFPTYSLSAII